MARHDGSEAPRGMDEAVLENPPGSMAAETAGKARKRRSGRRGKAKAAIVTILAIAAIGAGFWSWHETPQFCGSVCHTPMEVYYDTYASGANDKLGNPLDEVEASSMLSYKHKPYGGGMACMSCHKPVLSQQISEGVSWVSGNYVIEGTNAMGKAYLPSRSLQDLSEGIGVSEEEFCLNSGCHVATPNRESLAEKTKYLESEYNPHMVRHDEVDCSACHKGHTPSCWENTLTHITTESQVKPQIAHHFAPKENAPSGIPLDGILSA